MKIIKSMLEIEENELCVTVGNFDGVHLGHCDFLSFIKEDCRKNGRHFAVVTFIPHPAFVIKGQTNYLLNTYEERRLFLENLHVDYLLEINFTRDFSSLSPEDFLSTFIFEGGRVKKVFLGHDFHFGANKSGSFDSVKSFAHKYGVELVEYSEFKIQNEQVSSSIIRKFLREGEMDEARKLLGRHYFLTGHVIKGQGRGKQIGFPTANLGYDKSVIRPMNGVYITKTTVDHMTYESVTNVGSNPTFNTGYDIHIETHLLGFNRDIYGHEIKVEFIKKLRDEKKFSSVNELVQQITMDVENVHKYFSPC